MTLIDDRVKEVILTLEEMLKLVIPSDVEIVSGLKFKQLLHPLALDLIKIIQSTRHGELPEALLDWIANSIFYMRGEIPDLPQYEIQLSEE